MSTAPAGVDHLVIAAATLAEGVAWCEATLGVVPAAGGAHALMGTHNRLLRVDGEGFPGAYLEVIAIDPAATPTRAPGLRRWFDLDDEHLHDVLRRRGPRLVHFVAKVPHLAGALHALEHLGIDRGPALEASRVTPGGTLRWRISVRDDGQRLFYGALPTLIEWGEVHPVQSLPESGVQLLKLEAAHPRPEALLAAWEAAGLPASPRLSVHAGRPGLCAVLQTPHGVVSLDSEGA